ncbi:MAG: carbamoyltransferase [Flavobacteriales bacterium]|nr:carbamoyltransferase [Flavobacteriales bacterium]MCB9449734.1 carbamoyltransferase [Flavobacteriales bacterium]
MKILGISAFYHDSAAALVKDGDIIFAAQEERFTRKKHDPSFPRHAAAACLDYAGIDINDLDAVVFYDKPLLKFERLLETYASFAPRGLASFAKSMPVWLKEKMFLKKLIRDELKEMGADGKVKLLFPEHHLSHAASAYYPSRFDDAAILTVDGVGEWATASLCHGRGKEITLLRELSFPHSVGLLYSAFTYFLGFKVNSGEYKLMGLAPYGIPGDPETEKFKALITEHLVKVYEDGSVWLDQAYFNYATGLRMVVDGKWEALFGFPRRASESELKQEHCNLALAIQQVTEDIVLKMAAHARQVTGSKNICLAGGVALNCVANGKLVKSGIFEHVYIQPAAGDAGGALGAALAAHHIYFGKERIPANGYDRMKGSYLGPAFSDLDVEKMSRKYDAVYEACTSTDEVARKTAALLADGHAIGWFQGRMEWGPRALGNRSIIGDPRNEEMQMKLNLKIKYRESFRPFAPSVLAEDAADFFDLNEDSPYMLMVGDVIEKRRKPLPANYHDLPLKEKLYCLRSDVPAITHIDFSARVQSVHKETNDAYWKLIHAFKELTGYGLIINTSFNVRGEPIVCTPEDAYRCLMRTEMDYLVVNRYIFAKKDQPEWKEKVDWQQEFALD